MTKHLASTGRQPAPLSTLTFQRQNPPDLLKKRREGGSLCCSRDHRLLNLALLGAALLACSSAFAFRGDEKAQPGDRLARPDIQPKAAHPILADQAKAAAAAQKAGIRVEWNTRLGTPLSIRGSDLSQQGAFSGGKGIAAKGGGNMEHDAIAVLDNLSRFYRLQDAESEFAIQRTDADALGYRHVRLRQMHRGVPVTGGELVVHFNQARRAYEINGNYVPGIQTDPAPRLTGQAAATAAQHDLTAWNQQTGKLKSSPALVILASGKAPRLAYELTLLSDSAASGPGRWQYWIDALDGSVLQRINAIHKVAPPTANGNSSPIVGSILTGEGGQAVNVTGWLENGGYYYLHNTNWHWQVYNVGTTGWPDSNTYAYRATSDWGTSDRAEMSLANNFTIVQRYFAEVHGRNSFDSAGALARANVHEGVNYVNAYWDGSQFYFGDGDGADANSLAVLDIAAHEYAHAVTEYTANLVYSYESGALNESFSDIFGTSVEFFGQADGRVNYPGRVAGTSDWLCGEDSWLSSTALRDLRNPANTATVGAGNEQPSRYRGTYWYTGTGDNGGVHYNSGVQNFFFYLLCEGGSGNNDGIAYSITGIGVTNAEQIAFRALTVYCTANTDYRGARSAWISAAADLNPAWVANVSAAWSAVGVGAAEIVPAEPVTFRGPVGGPFTPASQTFTVYNWAAEPMNWGVVHTQAWLSVTPASGTIAAGSSTVVSASINAAANSLAFGIHADGLTFTNNLETTTESRGVTLRVGMPDYFTELFDAADNDLDFATFTFTPDGSPSFYSACREPATAFPTDPTGGTTVSLSDDSYAEVALAGTNTISLYGRRTNVFFIGSNGYLTMDDGDDSLSETFSAHFSLPRISALFDDLNPGSGGAISWRQTDDRVAVTFLNVPEFSSGQQNSFQIEMFFDGKIRITYLQVGITDGLAGLSAGLGVPADFEETDFTSLGACPPPDDLWVQPTQGLTSQGYEGGPFTPTQITYTLTNSGVNPIEWVASASQPWVDISVPEGVLDPATSIEVTVSINAQANNLSAGSFTDTVVFLNSSSGFTHSRSVLLEVLAIPGEIVVLDSVAPAADLQLPMGTVITNLYRIESITVTNTDPTYDLVISDISFGVFSEDFGDGMAQDWVETTDTYWSIASDEYRAQAGTTNARMQSVYVGQLWQNAAAQVTVRRTGASGSAAVLLLRATDDFNWASLTGSAYLVGIDGTGYYYVARILSGSFSMIQTWTASSYLNTGTATNTILASIDGPDIQVFFNGNLAWSGADTSLTAAGRVGLMGYSGTASETIHFFDDVIVGEPISGGGAISSTQQSQNACPLAGGTSQTSPPNAPAVPSLAAGRTSDVRALALTSGAFRLENVPTLPHSLAPGAAMTFNVVYQPQSIGSNHAEVVIQSNDADEPEVEVQVTGTAIPDPLAVTPITGLVSQGHPGGPFAPASVTYVLSNTSPDTVNWTSQHSETWVNVSPASGSLAAGASANVQVSVSAAANLLPEGTYQDWIIFSNVTTTIAQQRGARLTVFTSPQVHATPSAMSVTNAQGSATNLVLTVSNASSADGNLTFRILARETGRDILSLAASGIGVPPANHDFTKLAPNKEFNSGRLLVRFAAGVQPIQRAQILSTLGGASVTRSYRLVPGLCLVKLPPGLAVADALRSFNQTPGILYAEPDYRVKAVNTVPNDTRFAELWGMNNTSQTGGTPDADIDAPEAWDLNTGSWDVIVGVIDTGVDYTHPDLTNNVWTNLGEIPGNGLDDDGNGFIDDIHGFDFVNGDGDPMDDNDHGTHCSGTIGGEGNNGLGVVGVCWQVRIMGLKFLASDGYGDTSDAISCVEYGTLMGAQVLNNSWGGGGYEQALKDAIDAAGAAGVVFVAAAGNDYGVNNDTTPHYPSSYDSANVVAVMSTDNNDVRSTFSNYGQTSVDLAAPGTSILSCAPGGGYQLMSGTSMATPHVSGACALLLSANPALTVADVKHALMSTVDPVVPGQCVSGGRMNLFRAVSSVGAAWITLTPTGATNMAPGISRNITVTFDAGTLAPGTYSGDLVITCNDVNTPTLFVPVSMTILADPLRVTPTNGLTSSGFQGGPFSPDSMTFILTNIGTESVDWMASVSEPWLTVDPADSSLLPGSSSEVTLMINANAFSLTTGVHTASVTFNNLLTGVSQTRTVELTVDVRPLPPTEPYNPVPTNHATRVSVHTTLSWNNPIQNPALQKPLSGAVWQPLPADVLNTASPGAQISLESPQNPPQTQGEATLVIETEASISASVLAILANLGHAYDFVRTADLASLDLSGYSTIILGMDGGSVQSAGVAHIANAVANGAKLILLGGSQYASFVTGLNDYLIQINVGNYNWTTVAGSPDITVTAPGHHLAAGLPSTYDFVNNSATYYMARVTDPTAEVIASNGDGYPCLSTKKVGNGTVVLFINSVSDNYWGAPTDSNILHTVIANSLNFGGRGETFSVYLGTSPQSMTLLTNGLTETSCSAGSLAFNTPYFWQVVASNAAGSVTGAVWTFTTAADEFHFALATNQVLENAGEAVITVTRGNPAAGTMTIAYSTSDGTATDGDDYVGVSGSLTFTAGVTSTNIVIPVLEDALSEGSETVLVQITPISPDVLTGPASVLVIQDNDGPPEFRITALLASNSQVVDHNSLTSDDRGGIATSPGQVFVTGDAATARFSAADLSGGASLGRIVDGLCVNLQTEKVYALGDGTTPLTYYGGTVTTLIELDGNTGTPTGVLVPLSQSIVMTSSGNGIFSGYGRVVIHTGTQVYDIGLPGGTVTDLGTMARPNWYSSESWSIWGVAEYFDGALYLTYRENSSHRIVRSRVPDGEVTPLAVFSNLSDMASFTVSPSRNRWYFHYEGSGQFGGSSETLGYADAQFYFLNTNPPVIISQPVSKSVMEGSTATFSVNAIGAEPLTYQWQSTCGTLGNATNNVLTLPAVTTNQSGCTYWVVVSNPNGSVTSHVATLNVVGALPLGDFQIVALLTNNSRIVDHNSLTGDDRGCIAASESQVFYSGDSSTARFATDDLSGGMALGTVYDAMASDLRTGTIYSLANGTVPLNGNGGTVTALLEHDGNTGLLTGSSISLSSPINLPGNGGNIGIFAGYGRVAVYSGSRVYEIAVPSGTVTDVGAVTLPYHSYSENWAFWGVVENFGGKLHLAYVRDYQAIVRTTIPDGTTTVIAGFQSLSDMACFTVSIPRGRWYFHHEGGSQFGGSYETIGYADAQFTITPQSNSTVILPPAYTPGAPFLFSFHSVAGRTYVVEYKTNLDAATWTELQTIPGDGSLQIVTDPVPSGPGQRFYRLRMP